MNLSERVKNVGDVLEFAGEAISIQDRDFRVLYQNLTHRNLLGSHEGEFCYKAYQKNDRVCEGCPVERVFEDGGHHGKTELGVLNDRTIHVEVNASPIKNHAGEVEAAIELCRDITCWVEEQEASKEDRERLQKVLRGVAHEIRNPIFAISSLTQVLSVQAADVEGARQFIDAIQKEVKRLNTIVTEFTFLCKPQELRLEPVELGGYLQELVAPLREDFSESTGFKVSAEEGLRVSIDRSRFTPVMENLIENAIESGAREIEIKTFRQGQGVIIDVRDNGTGINEAHMERVMEPFFTTKKSSTGLGLPLSKKLVEEHGGRLRIQSSPGNGTYVRILLSMETSDS